MRWWHCIRGHQVRRVTTTPPAYDDTPDERYFWLCSCAKTWDGK